MVTRYSTDFGTCGALDEDEKGNYVSFDDYEELLKKSQAKDEKIKKLAEWHLQAVPDRSRLTIDHHYDCLNLKNGFKRIINTILGVKEKSHGIPVRKKDE